MLDEMQGVSPIADEPQTLSKNAAESPSPEGSTGHEGLTVVFNRQPRHLSSQEAVSYAQQGLKWEQFAPQYRKLRFLGEALGGNVTDMVDSLLAAWEQGEWEKLLAENPDNSAEAARLFAAAKQEREALWGENPKAPSEEERLAGEYAALLREIPDAPAFSDLPPSVMAIAEKEQIGLLDAFLRHRFREERRCAQAAADAARAAEAATGSQKSAPLSPDTAGEAFRRALMQHL